MANQVTHQREGVFLSDFEELSFLLCLMEPNPIRDALLHNRIRLLSFIVIIFMEVLDY